MKDTAEVVKELLARFPAAQWTDANAMYNRALDEHEDGMRKDMRRMTAKAHREAHEITQEYIEDWSTGDCPALLHLPKLTAKQAADLAHLIASRRPLVLYIALLRVAGKRKDRNPTEER